jgi:hypothetical protein
MSDHISKELAAAEIAKALSKLSIDDLKKIAEKYDVDISEALEGEYFTKADLADGGESLTDLAKRIGDHPLIDAAKKLDALTKRMNSSDAAMEMRFGSVVASADLTKAEAALAELRAKVDKQASIYKRAKEDEAIIAEFDETGRTPLVLLRRQGAERAKYLASRDE